MAPIRRGCRGRRRGRVFEGALLGARLSHARLQVLLPPPFGPLVGLLAGWRRDGAFLDINTLGRVRFAACCHVRSRVTSAAQALQSNIGDYTFLEAYERTRRIVCITGAQVVPCVIGFERVDAAVAPNNSTDFPRLLNYLTAPQVCALENACACLCGAGGAG